MAEHEKQDVTAGKGRRDEVGHTGIYPANGPRPEGDVPIRTPGDINAGPRGRAAGVEQDDELKAAERLPRKGDDGDVGK